MVGQLLDDRGVERTSRGQRHALPGAAHEGAGRAGSTNPGLAKRLSISCHCASVTSLVFGATEFEQGSLERETGLEPATSTLGRLHSTVELLPRRLQGPRITCGTAVARWEPRRSAQAGIPRGREETVREIRIAQICRVDI